MIAAPLPENEFARLQKLNDYQVMGTLNEQEYDDLTLLASQICGTPIALISLVDAHRQWFKSRRGLETRETRRELSFCAHALHQTDLLTVPDAQTDPRFADNDLVVGEPRIRFYAGAPLVTPEGYVMGTLCVLDQSPRKLSEEQEAALRALSRQTVALLELRRNSLDLVRSNHAQQQAQQALAEREQQFRLLAENSSDMICLQSPDGVYQYVSPASMKIIGYSPNEMIGRSAYDYVSPEDWPALAGSHAAVLDSPASSTAAYRFCHKSGTDVWVETSSHASYDPESGAVTEIQSASREITARKRAEKLIEDQREQLQKANARLEELAARDTLTNLKNRRAFDERLQVELERSIRHGSPLSVVLLDVDSFKQYNDTFGHPSGDEVLKRIGRLLLDCARNVDLAARYGGEKFALLLPDTPAAGACIAAERCRASIEAVPWPLRAVTASFGIATASVKNITLPQLIEAVDQALYHSKKTGRNRVTHAQDLPLATVSAKSSQN